MFKIIEWIFDLMAKFPETDIKTKLREVLYQEVVSERIVEYPLVFANLPQSSGKLLDVGCRYSNLVLQTASLGYRTYGIDLSPYPYTHPNLKIITGDIRKTKFKSGFFNCVTAISTIEHIGLGFYEKTHQDKDGDTKAINEIYRLLGKNGRLIFSAPFGRPAVTPTYRVYDDVSLKKLFKKFKSCKYQYFFRAPAGSWLPTDANKACDINSSQRVGAMVFAVCNK